MSKRKLHVWIVHEDDNGKSYRILGVYSDKQMAEEHRVNYITKNGYKKYVSVTKHAVRGDIISMHWFSMVNHG